MSAIRIFIFLLCCYASVLQVDAQASVEKKLFTALPSSYTGVTFRNDIHEDNNFFYYNYMYLYNGAGVSIGDINNDGLQDLYFSSTTGFNKLFLNLGNLQFKDITEQAGVNGGMGIKTGVNMIDLNTDGLLDIVVSKSGPFDIQYRHKIVYINNGNLTFTDRAAAYGLNEPGHTTQTYFLDFDKDGDMDAFFINHSMDFNNNMVVNAKIENGKMVMIDDTARQYVSCRLYENRNGQFTDISQKAGISTNSFALSASITDINNDGWPDIYVANDFKKPDYLFINNKNGTFSDKLTDYFKHISQASMGSDIADINNDGLEDVFVLDMAFEDPVRQKKLFTQHLNYDKFHLGVQLGLFHQYPHNVLQLNNGNGTFSEIAYHAGVAETDWSWTPLIADFDNDGWKDMYITNGLKRDVNDWDYRGFFIDSIKNLIAKGIKVDMVQWFSQIPSVPIKNYFYRNNGSLRFDNYTDKWTDEPASLSNGAAYADLDNDGDLDIVVNNVEGEAFVLKNNQNEINRSGFIRFRLLKDKNNKQEVYGTTVKLTLKNQKSQFQRYEPQRGYMSSNEHYLHFGTGNEAFVEEVTATFPSGKTQTLKNISSGQVLTLYEEDAAEISNNEKISSPTLFAPDSERKRFNYTHKENDFIDFKREPLIPYKCSRKGPFYAKADVNADGREDIYIGGAAGSEGVLMLQNADGSFSKKNQASFINDKKMEDGGAVFFDADGDTDMDLYVVSGGSEFPASSPLYQDRLYINDGKGNFTRSLAALPRETNNGSVVVAADIDDDGDMDLFVGGGVMPGKFPRHDKNIILQNNKGKFTNITDTFAPELANTGIVNYAAWGDIDGDKKNELIIAGEWMPVMIFKSSNNKLSQVTSSVMINSHSGKTENISMGQIKGWWNTILLTDIDKDGDLDILAGNRGTNSRIVAKLEEPCTVYAKDFDNNGSYDAILGYYIKGKCYPMYHRDQLIDQMPSMRKKFYRYHLYAVKTLDEILSEEQKKGMDIYTTTCFESGIFINEGNNHFRFEEFPELAQISTINDMIADDFDNDGNTDIIIGGNSSDPEIGTGSYDAMAALFLKGDGKGKLTANTLSGLPNNGEVRRIINLSQNNSLILLKNNGPAQVILKRTN